MAGYLRLASLSRLHYPVVRSTRVTPWATYKYPIRHLSAVFQCPRPINPRASFSGVFTRNYSLFPSSNNSSSISSSVRPQASRIEDTPAASASSASAPSEPVWSDTEELAEAAFNANPISSPTPVDNVLSNVVTADTLPPLQYGDLADLGLISWTPAGLVRWSLEMIQVFTGMPWFWAIVAGTAFWRVVLFPLSVQTARTAALVAIHQPEIDAAKKRLDIARTTKNPEAMAAAVHEVRQTHKDIGVNPASMLAVPLLQIPMAMGVFFGIKKMCELPVEQLKHSGVDFLPDLTVITSVADPYYILPIISLVMMNQQMKLAARDTNPDKPEAVHMLNAFRMVFPFAGYFMAGLPVGLTVSIITGVGLTALTSMVLQRAVVRRMLRIPPLPANPPTLPKFRETRAMFYKWLQEQQKAAEAEARRKKP